ncbi:MAG: zinc ribbon domain-containing protein [Deltaproteobacteria bacterium]|nr:zinc ribbon domain-containing protein [Deltaproteobacteria bacterium]
MPLYEFRCLKCNDLFEILVTGAKDDVEMRCPHCGAEDFERVISTTNYTVGSGKQANKPSVQSRQCGSGSCTTMTVPGYSRD